MRCSVGSDSFWKETTVGSSAEGYRSTDFEYRYVAAPRESENVTVAVTWSPSGGGKSSLGLAISTLRYGGSCAQLDGLGSRVAV
jgi:hypothetical protein